MSGGVGGGVSGLRLEPLGPQHGLALLAGQDEQLAREIIGGRWEPDALADFLDRAARWRADGPVREFAALEGGDPAGGTLVGGGGLHLLAPGLARGEAALNYWVLQGCRGRGLGHAIAALLVAQARADAGIARLVLRIASGNAGSLAVARGLGAQSTGAVERHPADGRRAVERWELGVR